MTIKVVIENADPRETAVIEVQSVSPTTGEAIPYSQPKELKGGEKAEWWVMFDQKLVVREVRQ